MKAAIIIPARLGSTRLPGKPLLKLGGKPIIQHVYERCKESKRAGRVIVAADSARIVGAVKGFGGEVVMTSTDHQSGTERIAEAARAIDARIIVNVQGDEPEIEPASIDALIAAHEDAGGFATTLASRFPDGADPADPSAVKVVLGRSLADGGDLFEALYFTRAKAPYDATDEGDYYLHVGVYAFSAQSLARFAAAPSGRLERREKLEQLRILEMGERINVRIIPAAQPGIDTRDDFERAAARFSRS